MLFLLLNYLFDVQGRGWLGIRSCRGRAGCRWWFTYWLEGRERGLSGSMAASISRVRRSLLARPWGKATPAATESQEERARTATATGGRGGKRETRLSVWNGWAIACLTLAHIARARLCGGERAAWEFWCETCARPSSHQCSGFGWKTGPVRQAPSLYAGGKGKRRRGKP